MANISLNVGEAREIARQCKVNGGKLSDSYSKFIKDLESLEFQPTTKLAEHLGKSMKNAIDPIQAAIETVAHAYDEAADSAEELTGMVK